MNQAADMEHTTGWERLAEAAAKKLESYGPRSQGRRTSDRRNWWVMVMLGLLQGGFFVAWRMQLGAQEKSLAEERRLRSEQNAALVRALDAQADAMRGLTSAVGQQSANLAAVKAVLEDRQRGQRGGGR